MAFANISNLTQIVLILFAVYHLGVGIPSISSLSSMKKIAWKFYSLKLPDNLDPRYEYALKAIGFYAITLGLMCIGELFEKDHVIRSYFLACLSFLLISRAMGRFFYRDLVEKAFQINWKRSRVNVIFNLVSAFILATLAWFTYRS